MRRALLVTGAAIVGVVWIADYKVASHSNGIAAVPPEASPSPAKTAPSASPRATPTPSATPSGEISGTYTGADFPNRFGDVQVRVVLSRGHIVDVQPVQLPYDRAQSAYISQVAGPMLRSEVLQAQSARIDIISGATYTSESYAQSVESALKKAHLG